MKKSPLLTALLCITLLCHSQSGLYLTNAASFTIKTNTIVAIDGLVLTPSSTYTISGPTSLTRNTTLTHSSVTPAVKRSFYWSTALPAFTGSIGLYYTDLELNGLAESELTLNIHNATIWQAYASGVSRNATTNVITTPVSGVVLSELALAAEAFPLPLQWGTITSQRSAVGGLIQWQTHHEIQTAYFQVERSLDGIHWSSIEGTVPAMNAPGVHHYQFVDRAITSSKTFYRIRQVDSDGQASYSAITWISALKIQATVSIYPNPAHQELFVQAEGSRLQSLHLFDATGKLVSIKNVPFATTYTLPIASLPKGLYTLLVQLTDGNQIPLRFIKS